MRDRPSRRLRAVLVLALLASSLPRASAEMQKLQVGEITISYPAGLESAAKELAKAAEKTIPPRREKFLQVQRAYSDGKALSKRITDLMGAPENAETPRWVISSYSTIFDAMSGMFDDLRIYRESDLRKSGGLSEGPVRLMLDAQDQFQLKMDFSTKGGSLGKAFMPFTVGDDGRFRTQGGALQEALAERYDRVTEMSPVPMHEAAEGVLVRELRFNHPFARWFNEGTATWVMLRLIAEVAPSLVADARRVSLPGPKESSVRSKVNLLAWPLDTFVPASVPPEDRVVVQADYQFSAEAVDRMLRDKPEALAGIVGKLKGKPSPDSDAICEAITQVTGRDAKGILMEYVPDYVRTGLKDGAPKSLLDQARQKVLSREDSEAVKLLSRLLEITPSDYAARLHLACAMRKAGTPRDESERQIALSAALMSLQKYAAFDPVVPDAESEYVVGRLAQQLGDNARAKDILERVLKLNPDHADAQSALKEIESGKAPVFGAEKGDRASPP